MPVTSGLGFSENQVNEEKKEIRLVYAHHSSLDSMIMSTEYVSEDTVLVFQATISSNRRVDSGGKRSSSQFCAKVFRSSWFKQENESCQPGPENKGRVQRTRTCCRRSCCPEQRLGRRRRGFEHVCSSSWIAMSWLRLFSEMVQAIDYLIFMLNNILIDQ